jgi:hypothetical protein
MEKNITKHRQLLKLIRSLKIKEDTNSLYTEEEIVKLKTYQILLFDYFLGKRLDSYLELFTSFLNSVISCDRFSQQFITLRFKHIREFDELMKQLELMNSIEIPFSFLNEFNFDLNVIGITTIIDLADQNCDALISDELLLKIRGVREKGEIDENQFREKMKQAFLEISKMKQC